MKNLSNINDNKDITTKEYIDTELSSKSDSSHNHNLADLSEKSYNSLTDKPTSMPADGGNADTVDNISSENLVYCQEEGEWHNTLSGAYGDEKGYLDSMFVNKFDFFPVSNIFVEKSSDGNTWSETNEYSDQQIQKFVGGDSNSNIYIPNTGTIGAGYRRFTFTQKSYVFLNALYLYTTCVSGTLEVKVEKRSFDTQEWITVKDFSSIRGWPSHHILKHSYIPFNDWSGQYDKLRLTFYGETTNETYPNHTLYKMQWWGSYPAGKRTLYHTNEVKDVFFPAKMYAEGSQEIWHAGNDGSGSGLDADKLDNQEGTHYLDRSNHTGNQPASTISDFDTEVSNNSDVDANTTARHSHSNKTTLDAVEEAFTTILKNKLDGIDSGANNYVLPSDVVQDSSYVHTDNNYTTTEKNKLAGIDSGANNYSLPIAGTSIGGVKEGGDISIDSAGVMTVNDDSHNHIIGNIDGLQTALDNKSDDTHDHDSDYEPKNTNIQSHISNTSNPHSVDKTDVGLSNVDNAQQIPMSQKGANSGVAELDASGKILTSHLPSYVDDVIEASSFANLPGTGETGKIYITTDNNKTYRWGGSSYAEISPSIALGETSATAYRGDRGKIAYDHSQSTHAPSGAEANNISDANATDLTDGGDSSLHYHSTDRNRSNHTGSQLASTISNFASTVRSTVLTGLSIATNAAISATDSILIALGKLQAQITDHKDDTSNPHSVDKADVGLSNVDNTSDANKPISSATQTALNGKSNTSHNHNLANLSEKSYNSLTDKPDLTLKADKTNVLELNNTTAFTPDADYEPATKKYVDDKAPNIAIKREEFTASEGQTLFSLTQGTYEIGKNRLSIYVWGRRQPESSFSETSSSSITLSSGLSSGDEVLIEWFEF